MITQLTNDMSLDQRLEFFKLIKENIEIDETGNCSLPILIGNDGPLYVGNIYTNMFRDLKSEDMKDLKYSTDKEGFYFPKDRNQSFVFYHELEKGFGSIGVMQSSWLSNDVDPVKENFLQKRQLKEAGFKGSNYPGYKTMPRQELELHVKKVCNILYSFEEMFGQIKFGSELLYSKK